jgi:hypothetical protein
MALKKDSSIITISTSATESAAGTFTSKKVDLQLNPLDNEVFVVTAVNLDAEIPELIAGTNTNIKFSVSSTERTSVGSIADSNVIAHKQVSISDVAGAAVLYEHTSMDTPPAELDYIFIIATNDFYLNVQGTNNVGTMTGNARLYGYRARADAATYSALVQSEILS